MNKAYAGLRDLANGAIDFERLGDRLSALGAQIVVPEAAKGGP